MKSLSVKLGVLLIGLAIFGNAEMWGADSIKGEHKLQEQCDKHAEEYFKMNYGSGYYESDEGYNIYHYTNHSNRKLNKCFVLLVDQFTPKKVEEREKHGVTIVKELLDINENRVYGWFFKFNKYKTPSKCEVLGNDCNSESGWDSLIKPYMEE